MTAAELPTCQYLSAHRVNTCDFHSPHHRMSSPQASLLSGCRFAICVAVVFVCWDVRPIFNLVWGTPPLRWLMEYVDPRHPSNDPLHGEACLLPRSAWTWSHRSTLLEAMQPMRP